MRSHLDCNPSLSPHARNALVHHMNSNTQRDHVFDPHHLVIDALAGTVTFIVSLPLCLGIAIASDAPIISGVIAGIVAGVVVGALSGAHVVVSGPAAGLTAVVAAGIATLGSFERLLFAVVIAGAIQIVLGVLQGGFLKSFVPTSVVRGLLSAIGVVLILKQIPHLFGRDTDPEGEMSFFQPDRLNTFTELIESLPSFHPGAASLGLVSLLFIAIWNRMRLTQSFGIPAPLPVVVLGVAAASFLDFCGAPWAIEASHRVSLPVADSVQGFLGFLHTPDFSVWSDPAVYTAAITIALVGSLQAILTAEAVDRIDPFRHNTPASRELIAQGVGNCVSGLTGGLPITCEIVRSSVNIDAGARTKAATITHGSLLAISLMIFPYLINLIPLSSLAAILIATGARLANRKVFTAMIKAGRYQFIPYTVTLVAIVFTDPLVGIVIGLIVSVSFILWSTLRWPMKQTVEHHISGDITRIELANQVSFLNRAALQSAFNAVTRGKHILIDAHNTVYIDPDILEIIREFRNTTGPARGVHVSTRGFRPKYSIEDHVEFVDFSTREFQQDLNPEKAFRYLMEGSERFRTGHRLQRDLNRQVVLTAHGQHPIAVVLSCIDSRSPAELLFDLGLGDIFSVRVAGNIATDEVLGSIEFACSLAGAKLIVVLGHTRCGAVAAAVQAICHPDVPVAPHCVHLKPIIESIGRSVDAEVCQTQLNDSPTTKRSAADTVAWLNVSRVVGEIRAASPVLEDLIQAGRVGIVGMMYDISSGEATVVPGTATGLSESAVACYRVSETLT